MSGDPLKIALAVDHLGSGGAQRQLVEIACDLVHRSDVAVTVLVYRDNDFFLRRLEDQAVPVVRFPKSGRFDLGLPGRITAWLRENSPDVVHSFLLAPTFWYGMGTRRVPESERPVFLAAERDDGLGEGRSARFQRRLFYNWADGVTANSRPAAEVIHERYGVPRERIRYLPNGIDLEAWDRSLSEPAPFEMEPDCFHLGLIGRLERQKNHALVLEALSRLGSDRIRDWRIWFVGSRSGGEFSDDILAAIEQRGLSKTVRWMEPTPKVAALIRSLDGVLLPSHHEGFPNVLLEAMASGVPAIAAPAGDVPSLLEDGVTGYSVDPLDADDLASALVRLHDCPASEREAMGRRAREIVVDRYRISKVVDQHVEVYREARDSRRR